MEVILSFRVQGLGQCLVDLRGSTPVQEIVWKLREDDRQQLSGSHIYSIEAGRYGASIHSIALLAIAYDEPRLKGFIQEAFEDYLEKPVEAKLAGGDVKLTQGIEIEGLDRVLKDSREMTGLSAQKVEDAITEKEGVRIVSAPHIYTLEKGGAGISFETLAALASFYKRPELIDRVKSGFLAALDSEFSPELEDQMC